MRGDDKVMCGCGQPNPKIPSEHRGLHHKRFLEPATVDEWVAQRGV